MHIKIALTGKMRSGKDTVYSILAEELGLAIEKRAKRNGEVNVVNSHQHTFGEQLKKYAELLFPDQFVNGGKPRKLFQDFGQAMRKIDENIWVNKADQAIANQLKLNADIYISFITDLRQPNEYAYCRDNNYTIIRINASDDTRLARMTATGDNFAHENLQHETEVSINTYDVDYEIDNNISSQKALDQIRKDVQPIIKNILKNNLKELTYN